MSDLSTYLTMNASKRPQYLQTKGIPLDSIKGDVYKRQGCNKLQGQYTSGTCSVSQKAAEAAYTLDQSAVCLLYTSRCV